MNRIEQNINWQQAERISQGVKRLEAKYLDEFQESSKELFDLADYEYYATMTGIPVENLMLMT